MKKQRTGITKVNTIIYRAKQAECGNCEHKQHCCPKVPRRKIAHSLYESSRDVARAIAKTDAYKQARKERKSRDAVRPSQANPETGSPATARHKRRPGEFLLAATAQNLRWMVKLLSQPPPIHRVTAPG